MIKGPRRLQNHVHASKTKVSLYNKYQTTTHPKLFKKKVFWEIFAFFRPKFNWFGKGPRFVEKFRGQFKPFRDEFRFQFSSSLLSNMFYTLSGLGLYVNYGSPLPRL
jgi:hypothetical protein